MFIHKSQSGYNRYGEQFARGSFLMVFSHNPHKAEEEANPPVEGPTLDAFKMRHRMRDFSGMCSCAGEPAYYQKYCEVHKTSYVIPQVDTRKLYACVRHVSLRQLGAWMMGTARIAGQSVTVSGSYGHDGLPMDYEKLTMAGRCKLVEVPKELADKFWNGGGWNSSGSEGPAMRQWAVETFKKGN